MNPYNPTTQIRIHFMNSGIHSPGWDAAFPSLVFSPWQILRFHLECHPFLGMAVSSRHLPR